MSDWRVLRMATAIPGMDRSLLERLDEKLPGLAQRAREMGIPEDAKPHILLATRQLADRLVEEWEGDPPLVLDFTDVEMASPPFVHQLRLAWPDVAAACMSEDVAATWALVTEVLGE